MQTRAREPQGGSDSRWCSLIRPLSAALMRKTSVGFFLPHPCDGELTAPKEAVEKLTGWFPLGVRRDDRDPNTVAAGGRQALFCSWRSGCVGCFVRCHAFVHPFTPQKLGFVPRDLECACVSGRRTSASCVLSSSGSSSF